MTADFDPAVEVQNAEVLTSIFGKWPSFHDAEVLRIVLLRAPSGALLECTIHVFEMNRADTGALLFDKHTLVTFRFEGLQLHELKWFNHQNAIDALEIARATDGPRRYEVYFPSNWGCEAYFACDDITIVDVKPYAETQMRLDGSVYVGGTSTDGISLGPAQPI